MDSVQSFFERHGEMNWLLAAGIAIGAFIGLEILKTVIAKRLVKVAGRIHADLGSLATGLLAQTKLLFLVAMAAYIGSHALALAEKAVHRIDIAIVLVAIIQVGIWIAQVIRWAIERYIKRQPDMDVGKETALNAVGYLIRGILWVAVLLVCLDHLGVDITALVAGLGVGGVAVALAVQSILGDLFSSLTIILDRPFVIGDFIIIDEYRGTVERIGLKTTRIRSLSGELLVFGNADLLSSRIRNYKQMQKRRIVFGFGVIYQTPSVKLEKIPGWVEEIITELPGVRYDRAHFSAFGASSLDFEVVYWVDNSDYVVYMDRQQSINHSLFKKLEQEGIEFAYPTQTLFVSKES